MGKFLRNALVYHKGASAHYSFNTIIRSTQTPVRDFVQNLLQGELLWPNLRLIPTEDSDGLIGAATISGRNPLSSKIYGWWEDASARIWLLVDTSATDGKRLGWVISSGMAVQSGDLVNNPPPNGNQIPDYNVLDPGADFSDGDLRTLLGLPISTCD